MQRLQSSGRRTECWSVPPTKWPSLCLSVDSQKLQLLTTSEIQTPISYGSFVTEKLGLKMEIPSAQWTEEETSIYSRQEEINGPVQHREIVRIFRRLYHK